MCGFLDPTEGRILLNGEDIRKFNRNDYYALFSAVFQVGQQCFKINLVAVDICLCPFDDIVGQT